MLFKINNYMGILRKGKKEIRILEEIQLRNIETYEFKKAKVNKNDFY